MTAKSNSSTKANQPKTKTSKVITSKEKQTNQAVRESGEFFRSTLDNMLEGCQILGFDWRYLYLNAVAQIHNHRSNQELLGNTYMEMWPGIESTHVFTEIKRCMDERIVIHVENRFVYPDGAIGWFNLSIQPIPEGIVIFSQDVTERKLAEQEIVRLASFPTRNPNPVVEIDSTGAVCYMNPAAQHLFPNLPSLGFKHPWLTGLEDAIARFQDEGIGELQREIQVNDHWYSQPIYYVPEAGQLRVYGTEITERKLAQRKTAQLKRLYATLSQVNQMIVRVKEREELFQTICDVAVQFGELSLAWVGLLDKTSGDVLPMFANGLDVKNWPLPIVNIHIGPLSEGLVAQSIRTSSVVISEDVQAEKNLQILHNPFDQYNFHSSAVVPFRLRNSTIGVLTLISQEIGLFKDMEEIRLLNEMGLDISFALDNMENEKERKKTEEALKRNGHVLQLFVEHSPASIAMLDREMKYIVFSHRYLIDYGLGEQDLTGRSHYDVFPEISEHWKEIHRRCLLGAIEKADEDPFIRTDGRTDWVRWEIHPWYEEPGKVGGLILFSEVVTERKQVQDELQLLNLELEQRVVERTVELSQASRAKDEFLANMSHELRTPLNTVLGLSESLLEQRRGALNEKQIQSVELIASSGQHLLNLINDILEVSKIEAGKLQLHPTTVSVKELCESSLNFVKESALRKLISVEFNKDPSISVFHADPQRIKQILINLLTNAVKFTSERGSVTLDVNTNEERDQIMFSITDTGIGIAHEDLQKLFIPFTQLDSGLSRLYEGTGLGLALVHKLTDLHGGSVRVESESGKGSRFTVALPLSQDMQEQIFDVSAAEPAKGEQDAALLSTNPKERGVILVADDNEINSEMLVGYLEERGYSVLAAWNGEEVLEKAAEFAPDIILMDIQMPKMDGLEATRRLRADPRFISTPIVALTALVMPGDKERCLEAGANEYLSKPVNLKMVLKVIERLIQPKS